MTIGRGWKIAGATAVVVGLAATWTIRHYHLFDGSSSTPLSIQEARDRYRENASSTVEVPTTVASTVDATVPASVASDTTVASATSTTSSTVPAADAVLPPLGVYVYTTTGKDTIDALTGAHHDYPATTTITVTASDCGVLERWDVLEERWEAWQRCVEGADIRQPARTTSDQFFGMTQTDVYACTGDARPTDAPAGTVWTTSCAQGTELDIHNGTVVGNESLKVGDSDVQTLHVRVDIATPATPTDVQTIDTWYQIGSDLVIAQTAHSATTNPSPVGEVHYTEDYEIHLTSLTPLT